MRNSLTTLVGVLGLVVGWTGQARAGLDYNWGLYEVGGADPSSYVVHVETSPGPLQLNSGPINQTYPYDPGHFSEGQAIGSINQNANRLFQFTTHSEAYTTSRYGGTNSFGEISLTHRDVIHYSGTGLPPTLRVSFHAEGHLAFTGVTPTSYGYADPSWGYQFGPFGDTLSGYRQGGSFPPNNHTIRSNNLGDPTFRSYDELFYQDVNYDSKYGGYAFSLNVFGISEVYQAINFVTSDVGFGNTVSLTGVSLSDGTVIDPNLLTFESGLSLSAVPEPSSIVSAIIGGLMGIGYAWRRRKAKLAA